MRVLLYARHRYPIHRDVGSGFAPRSEPSGAPGHVLDLLARGLAEHGHEVDYLLPAGVETALPDGVRLAKRASAAIDVCHNVQVDGRPWVVTVHAHRPPAGYFDRLVDGELVPHPGQGAAPPYELPPNAICVSRTLARSFGGERFVLNGVDPDDYLYSETKHDYFLFMAGMQGPSFADMYRRKGLELALALAGEMGFELVVAGGARERAVVERVAALCRAAGASYVGHVGEPRKAELLAGARALLLPTRLDEGCPLSILEALMSGTPVICSDRGACPELVGPKVGFVCPDEAAFRVAIEGVASISPRACRELALRDFHYRRMAADYVREYEIERPREAALRPRTDTERGDGGSGG
ncbi:MAG: glycosyltransferase [Solirubrobacterales bacterium]|nr:glycosyltransferase [Solirubrobacterales bacterium]